MSPQRRERADAREIAERAIDSASELAAITSERVRKFSESAVRTPANAVTLLRLLFSVPLTLGVAVGGALGVANFYALRCLMAGIFRHRDTPPKQIAMTLLLMLKFGVLGGALYLVLTYLPVNGLALLFGVSLVVLSILAEGFRSAIRASREGVPAAAELASGEKD